VIKPVDMKEQVEQRPVGPPLHQGGCCLQLRAIHTTACSALVHVYCGGRLVG
jgi:hypothetical protein